METRSGSDAAIRPPGICRTRWRALTLSAALCACASVTVRADELTLAQLGDIDTFRYTELVRANYVRATLEVAALLGLGFAQYVDNHDFNSQDWDFSYDWVGLRRKLSPSGYSLDTNGFDTNFITHPAAGSLYYWAARSNRMSPFAAFAYAFVASTLWEYFGELRERASVNDLLVTPLAGFVLGEATIQLGLFFDRSCASPTNRVLGAVFSPFKALHDALDEARPLRALECDRYGLPLRGSHELRLSLTSGALFTLSGPNTVTSIETQLALHTLVIALDNYGRDGTGFSSFDDANSSEFWLRGAWTGSDWNDFTIRAAIVPVGLHYRSIRDRVGHEVLLGLLLGTEYNVHRFGSLGDETRRRDRYFALDAPGVKLCYRRLFDAGRLELELLSSVALAGIEAFALPEYLTIGSADTLSSVARRNAYNYAVGLRVNPRAKLVFGWFSLGVELTATQLWVINALDRVPELASDVSGRERRTSATAWLEAAVAGSPLRLTLITNWLARSGQLASVHASRSELRVLASIAALL